MKRLRKRGVIATARQRVSIVAALRELGVEVDAAPEPGINRRVYCPFGEINHDDGGRERQMRVYFDNSAYCFECSTQYDSVSLMAAAWGCAQGFAARRLLDRLDSESPDPDASRLPQVRAGMVAALGVWADTQDVDRAAASYAVVLARLDGIESEDEARRWLMAAKRELSGIR